MSTSSRDRASNWRRGGHRSVRRAENLRDGIDFGVFSVDAPVLEIAADRIAALGEERLLSARPTSAPLEMHGVGWGRPDATRATLKPEPLRCDLSVPIFC